MNTNTPRIELKNIKHLAGLSEETLCFQASLYIDGRKCGVVSNRGHGACHDYTDHDALERLSQYAATLPATSVTYGDETLWFKQTADGLIDEALNNALHAQDLRKLMRNRVVFLQDGKIYQTTVIRSGLGRYIEKYKSEGKPVLNLMPFPEALDIYRKNAA